MPNMILIRVYQLIVKNNYVYSHTYILYLLQLVLQRTIKTIFFKIKFQFM